MSDDLRTEDDIARLFADANPIPNDGRADDRWRRPGTDLTSITRGWTRSEVMVGFDEPTERRTVHGHERRRWLLAAAAVALVVSLVIATWDRSDHESDTTATPITTPDTLPPTRLTVVADFVAALSAHDVEAASLTLAPDVVPALAPGENFAAGTALASPVDGSVSLADQLAWLAAFGWTWEVDVCREQGDGVYCTARERNRLSDLVPLEMPVTMLFGFDGGLIDRLVLSRGFDEYGPEAFAPFYEWMLANHPDDVERLWISVGNVGSAVMPIVTQDAAEVLDARLTEFTAARADAAPADGVIPGG